MVPCWKWSHINGLTLEMVPRWKWSHVNGPTLRVPRWKWSLVNGPALEMVPRWKWSHVGNGPTLMIPCWKWPPLEMVPMQWSCNLGPGTVIDSQDLYCSLLYIKRPLYPLVQVFCMQNFCIYTLLFPTTRLAVASY